LLFGHTKPADTVMGHLTSSVFLFAVFSWDRTDIIICVVKRTKITGFSVHIDIKSKKDSE